MEPIFFFILWIEKILDLNYTYAIINFNIILVIYELDEHRLNYQLNVHIAQKLILTVISRINETNHHHRIAARSVPISPSANVFSHDTYSIPDRESAGDFTIALSTHPQLFIAPLSSLLISPIAPTVLFFSSRTRRTRAHVPDAACFVYPVDGSPYPFVAPHSTIVAAPLINCRGSLVAASTLVEVNPLGDR